MAAPGRSTSDQNRESAATETNRLVALEQQSLCRKVPEAGGRGQTRSRARPKWQPDQPLQTPSSFCGIDELIEEFLARLQIGRLEAFGEAIIYRREKLVRLAMTPSVPL